MLSCRPGQPVDNKPGVFEINRKLKSWDYNCVGIRGTNHRFEAHLFSEVIGDGATHVTEVKYIYVGKVVSSPFRITNTKQPKVQQQTSVVGPDQVGMKHDFNAVDNTNAGSSICDGEGDCKRLKTEHFFNLQRGADQSPVKPEPIQQQLNQLFSLASTARFASGSSTSSFKLYF